MLRQSDATLKARWGERFNALPDAAREALREALADLRADAAERAKVQIARRKLPLAWYWHAISVYAGHLRRSIRAAPGARARERALRATPKRATTPTQTGEATS